MYNKLNLFIQFQDSNDLNNAEDFLINLERVKSSKLLYQKLLNKFNIIAYIKEYPQYYAFFKKNPDSWLKDVAYESSIDKENNRGMEYLNIGIGNLLLVFDNTKTQQFILYDDIFIDENGLIANGLNPNDDIDVYHYNTLDEVYEHIEYTYLVRKDDTETRSN